MYIDGDLQLHLQDMWCVPATEAAYCIPQDGNNQQNTSSFGSLVLGGANSAAVVLDHVRVYDFALPTGDLGVEAVCTNYGSCRDFGVLEWAPPAVLLEPPSHPFMPPSLRFVAGKSPSATQTLFCKTLRHAYLL